MTNAWEEPGMRDWVEKFLDEERQAGRTYTATVADPASAPANAAATYNVFSGGVPVPDDVFRGHVTAFMMRNAWDRDGGVGPWVDFLAVAVQSYLLDVGRATDR